MSEACQARPCNAKACDSPGCLGWLFMLILLALLMNSLHNDIRKVQQTIEARCVFAGMPAARPEDDLATPP